MWEKIKALLDVLRVGQVVANPRAYKRVQDYGNAIGGFILLVLAAVKVWGVELPFQVDADTADLIGGGVAAVILNIVLNNATSKTVGLLPPKPVPEQSDPYEDAMQSEAGTDLRAGPPGEQ
jgi:hypothetical protein